MPPGYQSLGKRQQAVIAALIAIAIFDILAVVSGFAEIRLLDRVIAGENVTDSEITATDTREVIFGGVHFLIYVASVVLFIRWFHRAYRNLEALAEPLRYGTGWAIGSWFVPFLGLWRPKQIMNDIWWGSAAGGHRYETSWLLWIWWLGYLITSILGNRAFSGSISAETPAQIRSASQLSLAGDLLDIPVAILAILVVRRATDRMEARAREFAAPAQETPPAEPQPEGSEPPPGFSSPASPP